jgi:PPOX class probable F420-dependent enzyme
VLFTPTGLAFLTERHLATLTSLRPDGHPHVTPVGFTWEDETGLARVITSGTSVKARNADAGRPALLCQVDGRRWLTLEGAAVVNTDPPAVRRAEELYARRYRPPRINPKRVVLEITVTRVYGTPALLA